VIWTNPAGAIVLGLLNALFVYLRGVDLASLLRTPSVTIPNVERTQKE
jgi:hypothetical protein